MVIYSIYRITNSINGKVYIGQSINPERRFRRHCKRVDSVISRAIAKYGAPNFTMEVIYQTTDENDVDWAEQHFIQEHKSMVEFGGYNVEPGGQVNKTMSETSKQKISATLTGRKQSEEHRANGAKSRTGRKATEEHKNNIRLAAIGKKRGSPSEETRLKIIETKKAQPKLQCPHCNTITNAGNLTRWHLNNCRLVSTNPHP